jgi:hypothetical protein
MDRRALPALLLLALATTTSSIAYGAGTADKLACLTAHEQGQRARNDGHTGEARRELVACARPACPALVEKDCSTLLAELEVEQPTLLLEARDGTGNETLVLHVFVDGVRVDEREGLAVPVDPGEHTLRIELPGHPPLEQRIVARPREKNRRVVFSLARPQLPPASSSAPPAAAWVFSAVGVAALGSFAAFALSGKSLEHDDASSCAPTCSDSTVSAVRAHYIAAERRVGVAAVSTAAALYFFLHRPAPAHLAFFAAPTPGGAAARLELEF